MALPLALIPILMGAAGIGGGMGLQKVQQGRQRKALAAGNQAVEQKVAEKTAPTKQAQISGTGPGDQTEEARTQGAQEVFQLFQSVLSPMLGQPMIPPPILPVKEKPSTMKATYNIGHGGKLSATVSEDPNLAKSKRDADWMEVFSKSLKQAPQNLNQQERMQWAIETAGQLGYMASDTSYLDYYDIKPETKINMARAGFIQELSKGIGYEAARQSVDAAYPGIPLSAWNEIKDEAYGLRLLANIMELQGERYGADLPPSSRSASLYQEAASRTSAELGGHTPEKDKRLGVPPPPEYTGLQKVGKLPDKQRAALLNTGLFTDDSEVTSHTVSQAMKQYREELGEEQIQQQVEAKAAGKAKELEQSINDLEFFVGELVDMSAVVNTSGGWARLYQGLVSRGSGWLQSSEFGVIAADFLATRKSFLAKFARAFGEVGVLTEFDIKRAEGMLPTIYDSRGLAQRKFVRLMKFVKTKQSQIADESWRLKNAPRLLTRQDAEAIAEQISAQYSREAMESTLYELEQEGIDTTGLTPELMIQGALPENPLDMFNPKEEAE